MDKTVANLSIANIKTIIYILTYLPRAMIVLRLR